MIIGKVIGTVIATRKDESLTGCKLMIVQPLDLKLLPSGGSQVMVDTVGAGIGETVLCASGAAARNALRNKDAAANAAIVGIIDAIDTDPSLLKNSDSKSEKSRRKN